MTQLAAASKNAPYWWEGAGDGLRAVADPLSDLPARTDVLVIGSGYSGMSAALTLARAGRQVVIIDAEHPGYGCSARNGGLIGPSLHKLGVSGLTDAYGADKARDILRESMDTLDWLKSFIADEGIECGLHQTGRFRGAPKLAQYDTIARECAALAKAIGLRYEMVSKADQHAEIGTDYYQGGVIYPDDGHLHPGLYALGFAERVRAAGAQFVAPARLNGLTRDGNDHLASVDGRTIRARDVVIATNGYTGKELPWYRRRVLPIRSAIITTAPLAPALAAELSPKNRCLGDASRLVTYFRLSPDGTRMIFGGRVFDRADKPQTYIPDLTRMMTRVFPQLSGTPISHAWSGTVAYTFDHTPHLGSHDGIWHVMGYCGSGVGRAGYFGHKLALQILGKAEGRTTLDGLDFPAKRFYNGTPWFLPPVLRWNSLMDRLGK